MYAGGDREGVLLWRVGRGLGPDRWRQMETQTKPSLRGCGCPAHNALIQEPAHQRNQMPRGHELGSAGRSFGGHQWDTGISECRSPALPPCTEAPSWGHPSGPACAHSWHRRGENWYRWSGSRAAAGTHARPLALGLSPVGLKCDRAPAAGIRAEKELDPGRGLGGSGQKP